MKHTKNIKKDVFENAEAVIDGTTQVTMSLIDNIAETTLASITHLKFVIDNNLTLLERINKVGVDSYNDMIEAFK